MKIDEYYDKDQKCTVAILRIFDEDMLGAVGKKKTRAEQKILDQGKDENGAKISDKLTALALIARKIEGS